MKNKKVDVLKAIEDLGKVLMKNLEWMQEEKRE
jgi:hypothetical protein